jgi:trypsin
LQKVDIPIVSRERCAARIREWAEEYQHDEVKITDAMVCAGYTKDGEYVNDRSPCNGDSGGPLVDTDTGVMVGIINWGLGGCGTDGYPTVYARVGKLRSFLDKHMD